MENKEHYVGEIRMNENLNDYEVLGSICVKGGNLAVWSDLKRVPMRRTILTNNEHETVKYTLVEVASYCYEIEASILQHNREFKTILKTFIANEDSKLEEIFNETIKKIKLGEKI